MPENPRRRSGAARPADLRSMPSRTPASACMCRRQVPAICFHDVSPLWCACPRFTHGTRAFGQSSAWLFGRLHRPSNSIAALCLGEQVTPPPGWIAEPHRYSPEIAPRQLAWLSAEQLVEAHAPVFQPLAITLAPSSHRIRTRHLARRRPFTRTPSKGKYLQPPRTRRVGRQLFADLCSRMQTNAFSARNRRQVRITRE